MAEKTTELCIARTRLEEAEALLHRISGTGGAEVKEIADKAIVAVIIAKETISEVYDRQMADDDK